MTARIELGARKPLVRTLNIKDPESNPSELDNSAIIPIVNINEGGFLRAPDQSNQLWADVVVRLDTEIDPTINVPVVIPGDNPSARQELTYGIGKNVYLYSHSLLLSATNAALLYSTTLRDSTFELSARVHEAKYTVSGTGYSEIFCTEIRGQVDFVVDNSSSDWLNYCTIRIALPPIVLMESHQLYISLNRNVVATAGLISGLTHQGLEVRYYANAIKFDVGAPVPRLRFT